MSEILIGFTDYSKTVFIPDPASTDGSGKTGLVAANLTVSYTRVETDNDVVVTDVTSSLNDLAALTTAHTDWGIKEVSSTLAPGLYRIDFADAVFASGAWTAVVYVMITTSAAAASPIEFELVAFNRLDGVRLGLTALPNAAADGAGGLVISDAGGLDADAQRADVAAILVDTAVIGAAGAGLTAVPWNAAWDAEVQSEVDDALVARALDHLVNASVAGTDIADDSIIAKLVSKSATADWDSYVNTTDSLEANRDNIGTAGAGLTAADDAVITALATAQTSIDDLPTNAELATALDPIPTAIENADALLNRDMATGTDSGSTTVRTVRQALRMNRNKVSIAGGTLTVTKEDDTTESWSAAVTQTAGDPVSEIDPAGP